MITDFPCWVDVYIACFQKYKKIRKIKIYKKKEEKKRKGKVEGLVWKPSKTFPINTKLQWTQREGRNLHGEKNFGGTVESKKRTQKKNNLKSIFCTAAPPWPWKKPTSAVLPPWPCKRHTISFSRSPTYSPHFHLLQIHTQAAGPSPFETKYQSRHPNTISLCSPLWSSSSLFSRPHKLGHKRSFPLAAGSLPNRPPPKPKPPAAASPSPSATSASPLVS